jgi:hypothetical protein
MSRTEFYAAELGEVLCVMNSFYELQEQRERQEWERMRMLAYMNMKPHDTKKRIKKPADILPFPWEKSINSSGDAKSFLDKAEAKDKINQIKWVESLKQKGLLKTKN